MEIYESDKKDLKPEKKGIPPIKITVVKPKPKKKPKKQPTYESRRGAPMFPIWVVITIGILIVFQPEITRIFFSDTFVISPVPVPGEAEPKIVLVNEPENSEKPTAHIAFMQKLMMIFHMNYTDCPNLALEINNDVKSLKEVKGVPVAYFDLGLFDMSKSNQRLDFNFLGMEECNLGNVQYKIITNREFINFLLDLGIPMEDDNDNIKIIDNEITVVTGGGGRYYAEYE